MSSRAFGAESHDGHPKPYRYGLAIWRLGNGAPSQPIATLSLCRHYLGSPDDSSSLPFDVSGGWW